MDYMDTGYPIVNDRLLYYQTLKTQVLLCESNIDSPNQAMQGGFQKIKSLYIDVSRIISPKAISQPIAWIEGYERIFIGENTLVYNEGKYVLINPQYITSPLFTEFQYLAEQRKQAMIQMSDKQREKILEAIKSNPQRFKNSKAF